MVNPVSYTHLDVYKRQIEHRFQALFELATELRTGDQRAHIQRQQALTAQAFGHLVIDCLLYTSRCV